MSPQTPTMTRQLVRCFRSTSECRKGAKLTNRTEVEEEWQFSAAGQAGVGLAQLVKESVCACLQWRQPRHRCVFQQSGAEGDGLRWGTRLKHLIVQGTSMEKNDFWEILSHALYMQHIFKGSTVVALFTASSQSITFITCRVTLVKKLKCQWRQEMKLKIYNSLVHNILVLEYAKTKKDRRCMSTV